MRVMWCSLLIFGLVVSSVSSQGCPEVDPDSFGICPEDCSIDSDCTNGQLCCSNGCGHVCMEPVIDPCANVRCAAPECNNASAGTIIPEGECCPVCACSTVSGDMVAAGTSFMNDCNTCSCLDNGLAICTLIGCPPPTDTPATEPPTLPTSTTPPVGLLVCPDSTGLIGTCDVHCTDDSNCTMGQLCCSNGCGYACMDPVLSCAAVSCLRPTCTSPAVEVTPQGSCCPVCGCPTPDGVGAAPGETYQPDSCNTCSCGQNGVAACTLAFCPPPPSGCQLSDGTSVNVGDTYMDQCNTCTCLEGGLGACTRKGCLGCTLSNGSWVEVGTSYKDDCNTCTCSGNNQALCTEIACRQGGTCPTVQSSNKAVSDCANECSSDDDCQYDRICCSNECGGRTCSDPVEMCQLIQCDWPICPKNAQPVTSPFSCCPYCPSSPNTVTGDGDGGTGLTSVASLVIIVMCGVVSLVF
ncbi:kielin/chordin-like protein [Dysidea avara]|uniref:kielin/chordin-like protein n=1 Tax=Dysidea avara TaxID=196820 RepID=UPI003319D9E8